MSMIFCVEAGTAEWSIPFGEIISQTIMNELELIKHKTVEISRFLNYNIITVLTRDSIARQL